MSRFPTPPDGPIAVVGAGTAGCVVAGRLAEAGYEVVLLEAGPAQPDGADPLDGAEAVARSGTDHLRIHQFPQRWSTVMVERRVGAAPTAYRTGRGVGGSSAVNGLVADVDPDDPALRGPAVVRRCLDRQRLSLELAHPAEFGPIDRAMEAVPEARRVRLSRTGRRRSDVASAYLDGSTVSVRPDTEARRLSVDSGGRVQVELADGDRISGASAVLCAGALHTPGLLLRSRLGTGVGAHLQDHPAVSLHLGLTARDQPTELVTGVVAERSGVQLVPIDHLGDPAGTDAALLVALMDPDSASGSITIDPATDAVQARFRSFSVRRDVERLRDGVRWALDLLRAGPLAPLVDSVSIDEHGTPATVLSDDAAITDWILRRPGEHVHAAASCGIGRALDEEGGVIGVPGVFVADAAAFPVIPRTGPHLPTVIQAEALVDTWLRGTLDR